MTQEKVIDKIKKLLRLSKSPAEAEAMLALQKAHELMLKHNITVHEHESLSTEEKEVITDRRKVSNSELRIANTIRMHHPVELLVGRGRTLIIIGHPDDVEIFNTILRYMVAAFEVLSSKAVEEYYNPTYEDGKIDALYGIFGLNPDRNRSRSTSIKIKNEYCTGFVKGMDRALTEIETQYALVLVTTEAVQKVNDKMCTGSRPITATSIGDTRTREKGEKDGYSVAKAKGKMVDA